MNVSSASELGERLGADRVLEPRGALPQPAERLDASGPVRAARDRGRGRAALPRLDLVPQHPRARRRRPRARWPRAILEIVAARGKMHNPETDSGGVALGTVTAVGERFGDAARARATRIVTLASLTLTPLRLDEVDRVDPDSAQVERPRHRLRARARALGAAARRPPARRPRSRSTTSTPPPRTPATSRRAEGGAVCVLGAGHAGKLALAAARDAMPGAARVGRRSTSTASRASTASSSSASATSASPPTCAIRWPRSPRVRAAGAPAGRPDRRRRQRHAAASPPRSC